LIHTSLRFRERKKKKKKGRRFPFEMNLIHEIFFAGEEKVEGEWEKERVFTKAKVASRSKETERHT
jgi:hypothetical protein